MSREEQRIGESVESARAVNLLRSPKASRGTIFRAKRDEGCSLLEEGDGGNNESQVELLYSPQQQQTPAAKNRNSSGVFVGDPQPKRNVYASMHTTASEPRRNFTEFVKESSDEDDDDNTWDGK